MSKSELDYATKRARAIKELLHLKKLFKRRLYSETQTQLVSYQQRIFYLKKTFNL